MTRAGIPATVALEPASLATTAPAPIIALCPIVTPCMITAPEPIQHAVEMVGFFEVVQNADVVAAVKQLVDDM